MHGVFTDGDGDELAQFTVPSPNAARGGDGAHCYANFKISLPNRDLYVMAIDGMPSGQFTHGQLVAANSPDVYPGLAPLVSDCATVCAVKTQP